MLHGLFQRLGLSTYVLDGTFVSLTFHPFILHFIPPCSPDSPTQHHSLQSCVSSLFAKLPFNFSIKIFQIPLNIVLLCIEIHVSQKPDCKLSCKHYHCVVIISQIRLLAVGHLFLQIPEMVKNTCLLYCTSMPQFCILKF